MTAQQQAEAALATFRRSMREGHPWVPGGVFTSNPGLDLYVVAALESWRAKNTPDEWCSCGHDAGDHTPGIGCERRGCPCRHWPIEEN